MKEDLIETIFSMYLGFALKVKKAIVPYWRTKILNFVPFPFELRRSRQGRGENVKELRVSRELGTFFAPDKLFHLDSSHTQYTLSILSVN